MDRTSKRLRAQGGNAVDVNSEWEERFLLMQGHRDAEFACNAASLGRKDKQILELSAQITLKTTEFYTQDITIKEMREEIVRMDHERVRSVNKINNKQFEIDTRDSMLSLKDDTILALERIIKASEDQIGFMKEICKVKKTSVKRLTKLVKLQALKIATLPVTTATVAALEEKLRVAENMVAVLRGDVNDPEMTRV